MTIEVTDEMYSVELCRLNPNKLYVFGDNSARFGSAGQAVIRNEPNAYGIATKKTPWVYMSDSDNDMAECISRDVLGLLDIRSMGVMTIVFPAGGLGTGLARMSSECPKLFSHLNSLLLKFGVSNTVNGLTHIRH